MKFRILSVSATALAVALAAAWSAPTPGTSASAAGKVVEKPGKDPKAVVEAVLTGFREGKLEDVASLFNSDSREARPETLKLIKEALGDKEIKVDRVVEKERTTFVVTAPTEIKLREMTRTVRLLFLMSQVVSKKEDHSGWLVSKMEPVGPDDVDDTIGRWLKPRSTKKDPTKNTTTGEDTKK